MNKNTNKKIIPEADLYNPSLYFNRELSWLEFNDRVLEEAQDKNNPLLERIKFLAITASNLDEFFMVRVSEIMDQAEAKIAPKDPSGLKPSEQLNEISKAVHRMVYKQYNCLNRSLVPAMEREGIFFRDFHELSKTHKEYVQEYFDYTLFPILTPMAIDQSRPFPLLSNKSLNIIAELDNVDEKLIAVVQVPSVVSRYLELPEIPGNGREIIFVEEIIKTFCHKLFAGYNVLDVFTFRITRNSDFTIDEEDSEDLLDEIEKSIKRRKWGEPVRLEIDKSISKALRHFLEESLEIDERDIYEILGPIDLTVLMKINSLEGFEHLRDTPYEPVPVVEFINKDIFEAIAEKDILIHHPYQSFDAVLGFVNKAAADPQVLAIKMTLYRVSGNSPIVSSLIRAAENGKQVTVLVELKARFDEENNILWAKKLEKSGCHVIYGLVGLKTHCKICLVVRKEEDGIRRYIHLGTGNYNDATARIYTDIGYFTCKETLAQDISALFNVLTGYSVNLTWNRIAVAPVSLRRLFISRIENEIENAKSGKPAQIIAKMNSLVDAELIRLFYSASMAGVKVKLLVRGICCLVSGVEGVSENILVASIIDRYLEHSRVYYFENGGEPEIFLSSADLMPRNLDRRVEVAFPITESGLKDDIIDMLNISFSDTEKLRIQHSDGTYQRVDRRGKEHVRSQVTFSTLAAKRFNAAVDISVEERFKPRVAEDIEKD